MSGTLRQPGSEAGLSRSSHSRAWSEQETWAALWMPTGHPPSQGSPGCLELAFHLELLQAGRLGPGLR